MVKNQIDMSNIEEKWKKFWKKEEIYKADFNNKNIYSVDTPPPTVSGKMHIGHAFSYSQHDFIVRFKRMLNGSAFFPFGTDDNGLPTERLIEKIKGVKSKEMSRADFIKLCLKTLKEITPDFIQDWKDIGMSCDFDVSYSTIDENSQKISQQSFIELYKNKSLYKKNFPTIWCPECQTAIAQAELDDKEFSSLFSTLKFKIDDTNKKLLIATTRPELLPACVAVFVNPKDKRYKKLVGGKAIVPLFNFEVPILEDESAEIEKGTGVLMVCSYGDKYDVDAIQRHNLNSKIILNKNGTLNVQNYEGLKIKDARRKILEDLKIKNLIKEEKEIIHAVNTHDKCGTEIEFIETEQWFIKILDKKKKFLEQGGKINWYPKFMFKRYENWVKGLEWDWNISRDRHFGIPIPVWECKTCNKIILATEKELPIDPIQIKKKCPKCGKEAEPEKKVLDTWASSSLTPQIANSLINQKLTNSFSLRPQAHDIIRTWAFYTIVKSYLHSNKIPWEDIVISGFVTLKGEKMSKSKGNVIDPQKIINDFGADALRFWAASSKLGEDLDYQEKDLITGKKLINKIINASKFVFMNLEDYKYDKPKQLEFTDKLFLKELDKLIEKTTKAFENYEYSKSKSVVEQFFWHEFADNYLEIVKNRIYNEKGEKKKSAQYVLYVSLLSILKMIAPIMPFITEEIYQKYFKKQEKEKSVHISKWPEKINIEGNFNNVWDILKEIIFKVRQEKSKAKKSMKAEIILTISKKELHILENLLDDLKAVTGAKEIREGTFGVEFI